MPLASDGSLTLLVANGMIRVLVIVRLLTAGLALVTGLEAMEGAVTGAVVVGAVTVVDTPSDPQAPNMSRPLIANATIMMRLMIPLA